MSDDRVRTGRDVALVIVAGAIALRWPTAALIALFAAGSVVRWVDGRSWTSTRPVEPWQLAAGAAIGAAALALALGVADPLVAGATARSVEWTQVTAVRGSAGALVTVALLVGAQAVAAELVFRRWLVDRALDAGRSTWAAAALAGVAEAWVAGGAVAPRLGVAVAGTALGVIYVGAGRRVAVSLPARLTFELGVLVLVWQRLV